MSRLAVLVVLLLSACTISPPLKACVDYGGNCERERALQEMTLRPREF